MTAFLIAAAYYVVGLLSGLTALALAAVRGPLPPGVAAISLGAFVLFWPVLLLWALVAHGVWLLEVRSK